MILKSVKQPELSLRVRIAGIWYKWDDDALTVAAAAHPESRMWEYSDGFAGSRPHIPRQIREKSIELLQIPDMRTRAALHYYDEHFRWCTAEVRPVFSEVYRGYWDSALDFVKHLAVSRGYIDAAHLQFFDASALWRDIRENYMRLGRQNNYFFEYSRRGSSQFGSKLSSKGA